MKSLTVFLYSALCLALPNPESSPLTPANPDFDLPNVDFATFNASNVHILATKPNDDFAGSAIIPKTGVHYNALTTKFRIPNLKPGNTHSSNYPYLLFTSLTGDAGTLIAGAYLTVSPKGALAGSLLYAGGSKQSYANEIPIGINDVIEIRIKAYNGKANIYFKNVSRNKSHTYTVPTKKGKSLNAAVFGQDRTGGSKDGIPNTGTVKLYNTYATDTRGHAHNVNTGVKHNIVHNGHTRAIASYESSKTLVIKYRAY